MGNTITFLKRDFKDTETLRGGFETNGSKRAVMARTATTRLGDEGADGAVAEALPLAPHLNGSGPKVGAFNEEIGTALSAISGERAKSGLKMGPACPSCKQAENEEVASDARLDSECSNKESSDPRPKEDCVGGRADGQDRAHRAGTGRLHRPPPLQVAVAPNRTGMMSQSPVLVLVASADVSSLDSGMSSASSAESGSSAQQHTGSVVSASPSALSTGLSATTTFGSLWETLSLAPIDGFIQTRQGESSSQSPSWTGPQKVDGTPDAVDSAEQPNDANHRHGMHKRKQRRRDRRTRAPSLLPPPLPPMVEPAVHTYVDALPAMPPKSPLPGSARGPLPPLGHLPDTGSCHSARVAGTYNLLHPFTRRGNFQIRHGEVIFKGHRSYHLMMQIKAGVRYTVERQDALASRNLCMADFRATSTVRFPTLGSADTPPIEKGFTFKDYAPMVFRHLRQRYGITAASYLRSLCGQEALREATTPGKSGSLFYYSSDDRFILKTLSKQEATVLLSILPQYYFHMMKNPESLITRFFGLHRITTHRLGLRRRRIRIVVMSNFLPTRTPIHLRYDLKGSTYGRFSRTSASLTSDQPPDDCSQPSAPRRRPSLLWRAQESDPRQPRKDLDLFRDGIGPISIDRRLRRRMLNQIDMDCLFLESVHIMDYSFLLGLHRIETPTSAPASTDLRRASTDAMAKSGNSWIGLLNNGEQARLFFGIIDVLDRYNTEKQLEHCWKARMLCLHNTISVIEPSSYARRFRGFLEKTFLPLPRTPQSAAPVGSKSEFVP